MKGIARAITKWLGCTALFGCALAGGVQAAAGSGPDVGMQAAPHASMQQGGMTLSEAVESVRRRGDVERVISAETKQNGGREVHHIRVMTRDGKIKTYKIQGRSRG